MRIGFRGTFRIDPAILEAGRIVAEHRGITRKEVFRSMRTAEVVAEAERIRNGEAGEPAADEEDEEDEYEAGSALRAAHALAAKRRISPAKAAASNALSAVMVVGTAIVILARYCT